MNNKEAIKALKRMKSPDMEPDEFHAIQTAIKSLEACKKEQKMKDATLELLIKSLINDFREYQIEWLTNHNDIEFQPEDEELIVGFLNDTANLYIAEHTE